MAKIKSKLGKDPETALLWHGTRATPPKSIYEGEVGFDTRFSAAGMWGIAIYFSKNALYSNSYCYTLPSGEKQFFLAEVLLGDYPLLPSNNALRMPPNNPANNNVVFDSVKGHTNGSDVYMVYLSNKAYPRYLVTYTA